RQDNEIQCHDRITLGLNNAVRQGQLPKELDTSRAAVALISYVNGIIYQSMLVPHRLSMPVEPEKLLDECMDILRFSPTL
ncbi:TetR family transcriptional regulator, partial [Pseudomonas syringae pv. tagetis]